MRRVPNPDEDRAQQLKVWHAYPDADHVDVLDACGRLMWSTFTACRPGECAGETGPRRIVFTRRPFTLWSRNRTRDA